VSPILTAFYLIPPAISLLLGLRAKSAVARSLLLYLGLGCFLIFAILRLAHWDCSYVDLTFQNCARLPAVMAAAFGTLQSLFGLFYLFAAPVLLVIAAVAEMVTRSKR